MNMHQLRVHLDELPEEILLIILKNLNNISVVFCLANVNKRFNKIAYDRNFTSHWTLFEYSTNDCIRPLPDRILDRFCSEVLPRIHHTIQWLNLESTSVERIFRLTNYSSLYGLGLYDINVEKVLSLITGELCNISYTEFK